MPADSTVPCGGAGELEGRPADVASELVIVEGLLLLAAHPLSSRKLAQLASLADGTAARTLVRRLNERYDREGWAFRVEEVGGGFQLLTRPQLAPWLRRFHPPDDNLRLSAPALETLAVIAYRQPVLRAQIEAIRGVQCGEMLKQLMGRDLVRIVGRSRELGRPFLYGTTSRFLRVFGLKSLDDLPRAEEYRRAAPAELPTLQQPIGLFPDREQELEVKTELLPDLLDEALGAGITPDDRDVAEASGMRSPSLVAADADHEEEEDDEFDDDDDDDLDDDDDDYDEDYDDDFEEDDWEEVEDEDDDYDDEDDEDWDDEDEDEDEDWEEEEAD
jgi:segregation and condensation protein B